MVAEETEVLAVKAATAEWAVTVIPVVVVETAAMEETG